MENGIYDNYIYIYWEKIWDMGPLGLAWDGGLGGLFIIFHLGLQKYVFFSPSHVSPRCGASPLKNQMVLGCSWCLGAVVQCCFRLRFYDGSSRMKCWKFISYKFKTIEMLPKCSIHQVFKCFKPIGMAFQSNFNPIHKLDTGS